MFVPDRDAVSSLVTLVGATPESANYLYEQFNQIITDQKSTKEFKDFLSALSLFVSDVEEQHFVNTNYFAGQRVLLPAEKLVPEVPPPHPIPEGTDAQNLTLELMEMPQGKIERDYKLPNTDYATADYATADYATAETYQHLDMLFQRWMAVHHIERTEGVMYLIGENDQKEPLSLTALGQLINDPKTGFIRYVAEESKGRYGISNVALTPDASKTTTPSDPSGDQGSGPTG